MGDMEWVIGFVGAIVFLLLSVFESARTLIKKKIFNFSEMKTAILSLAISGVFLFFPLYWQLFSGTGTRFVMSFLLSIHNTIRLFVVDGDFEFVISQTVSMGAGFRAAYQVVASVVFCVAPVYSFGIAINFLKNFSATFRFWLVQRKDIFAFSELNEKSMALAKDIAKDTQHEHQKAKIVFASANEKENPEIADKINEMQKMGAIVFRKPITDIRFERKTKAHVRFLLMNQDEEDTIQVAMRLINRYNDRENTDMYVFTERLENTLILANAAKGKMKIRRINETRSLTTRFLYDHGYELFDCAKVSPETPGSTEKTISAVILGMGEHGTEIMKALIWYCQMPGYNLKIHAFDKNPEAEDIFASACPEIMDEKFNGKIIPGENRYRIDICPGINFSTASFDRKIKEIKDATFVFVSLGSDERNVSAAIKMRELFLRNGASPEIYTIVRDNNKAKALSGIRNYREQQYNIHFVGDTESEYSEGVIFNSPVEQEALARHLKYGKEDPFWRYEYNYCSSVASALHMMARIHCGLSWASKKEEELTDEEKKQLADVEHRRWSAYMRTEGYVYSGNPDKSTRNDLAKMHHNLCTQLNEEDIEKDIRVGTK